MDTLYSHACERPLRRTARLALAVLVAAPLLAPAGAAAQTSAQTVLKEVNIDQKLDAQVPLDLVFKDETGQPVRLKDYVHDKPVVLALVYYNCPMLCTMVLNGLTKAIRPLSFTAGDEFEIVTVSFDPREGPELAAAKKETYLKSYGREGAGKGWHFLTGDVASVQKLTDSVGFRYVYDQATDQFAHASGIIVLTPEGKVSKYFYGIEYPARDLRLGLVEASQNKIGTPADAFLLFCYHYDPSTGKYGFAIMNIIRTLGIGLLVGLGTFIFVSLRRDRRRRLAMAGGPGPQS